VTEFLVIPLCILVAWLVIRVEWLGCLHFKYSGNFIDIIENNDILMNNLNDRLNKLEQNKGEKHD
jgi:hypothetical protein